MERRDDDHREEFWDRLEDIRTGMLEVKGRFVPMSHNLEPEDGNIWFLTAKGTDMAAAAAAAAKTRYVVCNDSHGIYADISGQLSVSEDPRKLDEVWSAMASSWFEDGKQDSDLVLVQLKPAAAEVWLGPESGFQFLFTMAKSKITGEKPDLGQNFSLIF